MSRTYQSWYTICPSSLSACSKMYSLCFCSMLSILIIGASLAHGPGALASSSVSHDGQRQKRAATDEAALPLRGGAFIRKRLDKRDYSISPRTLLPRGQDEEEGKNPKSHEGSTVPTSASSSTSGSALEEGAPPQLHLKPLPKTPFQPTSPSQGTQQSPGRPMTPRLFGLQEHLSPARGHQTPSLRIPEPETPREHPRGYDPEESRHWLNAATDRAWLRMKSADPEKQISQSEFTTLTRYKAIKMGLLGSMHKLPSHEAQRLHSEIEAKWGDRRGVDGWIGEGLKHYMTSMRPDALTPHGVAPTLETVRKENEEKRRQLLLLGHIR